jgi:hypothetical protein
MQRVTRNGPERIISDEGRMSLDLSCHVRSWGLSNAFSVSLSLSDIRSI